MVTMKQYLRKIHFPLTSPSGGSQLFRKAICPMLAALVFWPASAKADDEQDPGEKALGKFYIDGSVKEGLAKLTKTSGVSIELADGVVEAAAAHLASPIMIATRNTTVNGVLETLLMGSRMAYTPEGDKIVISLAEIKIGEGFREKKDGGPDVVMVLEFARREKIFYSGISGADFWFTIKEVKRFDEPQDPEIECRTLRKRSVDLDRYHQLQISIRGRGNSVDKAVKAFDEAIKGRDRFIVASSAAACSTTGTLFENFWGSMAHESLRLFAYSKENLARIDDLYIEMKKADSVKPKPNPQPRQTGKPKSRKPGSPPHTPARPS